ncbi:MAG: polysaccharide deacetylase family protein [Planctomycetota bacterium]
MRKKALVSIHDVMPSTIEPVRELIELCRVQQIEKITLLVVPGLSWTEPQLRQIRRWVSEGLRLAGHGWKHHCDSIRGAYHRFHSLMLSRDVAEHLSLSREGAIELLRDCGDWFPRNDFETPQLYVPPAWAMGALGARDLRDSPFRIFETLSGIRSPARGLHLRCPLVGFEADTWFRKLFVRNFNRLSIRRADDRDRPLRIGIHPQDHRLRLRDDLLDVLAMDWETLWYEELVDQPGVG